MDKAIIQELIKIVSRNFKDIYAIDIINDKVYSFSFTDELKLNNTMTFVEFVDVMKEKIHEDDVKAYFQMLSLNDLQEDATLGIVEHKFKFRRITKTGNYEDYLNIINFVTIDNIKMIFIMSEDISSRLVDSEKETVLLKQQIDSYKNIIASENASISEAILNINNVLDSKGLNSVNNIKTKDYINSVFSRLSIEHPQLNRAIIDKLSNNMNYRKPAILIIDDSSIIRNSLKRIFQDEFKIIFAKDGKEAIRIIEDNLVNINSDLKENIVGILLDLIMPVVDGFGVLDYMKRNSLLNKIPVAIISGDEKKDTRKKVYEYDIVDMLEKPFNTENIKRRISKIINLYISGNNLQSIVDIQNIELESKKLDNIENLKKIVREIASNIRNNKESMIIKKVAHIFASHMFSNDSNMVDRITEMCPLYNIGAIAISEDTLITKEAILKEIDYGMTIADYAIDGDDYRATLYEIIKYSCELYDGSGYPNNLKGKDIPISASIANIVVRLIQYTKIHKKEGAYKIITETEASKYNPDLISILINNKKEIFMAIK